MLFSPLLLLRSVVPDYSMFDADFDDADDAMMYDDGPVKFENEPIVNIKEEPMDSVDDVETPVMTQGNGFRGILMLNNLYYFVGHFC